MEIPRHSIRFGKSSEKRILEIHQHTFESVVINAHSLAYFGKSLSTFVFIKSKGKNFFIDPLTHAFQHPLDKISNEKGEIRPSIEKLILNYGPPISNIIFNLKRPLKPVDFSENKIKQSFSQRVLEFQRKHLFNCLEDDFKEYLEDDEFAAMLPSTPVFLVPPYFYMTKSNSRQWMPLNRDFIEISKKMVGDSEKIFGELVISKDLLKDIAENNEIFAEISGIYDGADGILFWIDEFDEHQENSEFLKFVIKFVKKIKEKFRQKPLINLYGGYFSQLLSKIGLDGIVHGPEYGESRGVMPVGGGIPIARFYYPEIHKRIPSNVVISQLTSENIVKPGRFFKEICSCKVCGTLIKMDAQKDFIEKYGKTKPIFFGRGIREFPVQETTDNCLSHYLEVKNLEFNDITKRDLKELLKELEDTYKKFKNEIWIDEKEIKHLEQWADALRNG